MKNVKLFFSLLMFVGFVATSCQKEYFGEEDFGEDFFEDSSEGAITLYQVVGDDIIKLKDFAGASQSYQLDTEKHLEMWNFFATLIPSNDRRFLSEFEIFDGENELLGYVQPINDNDLTKWKMGLAIDAANRLDKLNLSNEFAYTCIHEHGHILTLNHEQVDVTTSEANCDSYHPGEGCPIENSYIGRIIEIGWSDILDEHSRIDSDEEVYDFYEKYPNRFVTEYAATNPAEDVAEVFTMFVILDEMPNSNTIADQKVKAMYEFPELVELREAIRSQPIGRTLKPSDLIKPGRKHKCRHGLHQHKTSKKATLRP